jgi:hypothetical protein
MNELLGILRSMSEGGYSWQETIIVSLAIIGMTLSIIVLPLGIVRGITSIISLFMKTADKAIDKISIKSKTDNNI